MPIEYRVNTASQFQIRTILLICDIHYIPKLNEKVNVEEYAEKIYNNAIRFEAWHNTILIAILAMYVNKEDANNTFGYITNICVIDQYNNTGIASNLMRCCIDYATKIELNSIELEVNNNNAPALALYDKFRFLTTREENSSLFMSLQL